MKKTVTTSKIVTVSIVFDNGQIETRFLTGRQYKGYRRTKEYKKRVLSMQRINEVETVTTIKVFNNEI